MFFVGEFFFILHVLAYIAITAGCAKAKSSIMTVGLLY